MKTVDANLFTNSNARMIVAHTELTNVDKFLMHGDKSRTVVLPSGIQLRASMLNWYERQVSMVVPPEVRKINYLPVYKTVGLSQIQIFPDSQLEKIEDGAFSGTNITTFVAPASLCEVGYAAFINCRYLERVDLGNAEKVGNFCFWGTTVQKIQNRTSGSASYQV